MIHNHIIAYTTQPGINLHSLNAAIQTLITTSGIQQGQVLVFSRHTTTAIAVNENEPRLLTDIATYLTKLAPPNDCYLHNDLHLRPDIPADEPINAHSHLMAMTLGNSETIPIVNGQIALGTYQSIFLVELDGPRDDLRSVVDHRTVFCQIIDEL